jgi:hypothetical protein
MTQHQEYVKRAINLIRDGNYLGFSNRSLIENFSMLSKDEADRYVPILQELYPIYLNVFEKVQDVDYTKFNVFILSSTYDDEDSVESFDKSCVQQDNWYLYHNLSLPETEYYQIATYRHDCYYYNYFICDNHDDGMILFALLANWNTAYEGMQLIFNDNRPVVINGREYDSPEDAYNDYDNHGGDLLPSEVIYRCKISKDKNMRYIEAK